MRKTEFVESYFDAWNHRDAKGVADHLSADGTFRDVPENLQISPEELVIFLDSFFADHRHRYELIGEIQKSENTVAFQYRMSLPDNKQKNVAPVAYHGAEFITLRGDAAIEITDYYDIPTKASVNKYAKSGLTSSQLLAHKQRLDQIMQSREEYLRPDLTLPKLAETVGCSVNNLSQVINSGFGTSFFDYLNRYRIEHARKLLENSGNQGSAILTIAFTVGFNSNSAFYSAFKKYVGMTPAQYRQRHH
jgi:AraC-like DNA-binding protein/nuclear transport factor 2 (NTF2) superfamily protein